MSTDRLVSMANQIARFFEAQPGESAAEQTANHLRKFWDPRMRSDLVLHLQSGGAGLGPVAIAAGALLEAGAVQQAADPRKVGPRDDCA